jgi:D-threo-aldose 1-dehydrogenase
VGARHDPDQAHPGAAASGLRALTALKEEGLVDRIGVGTNATAGLVELIRTGHLDVLMLAGRFTLLDHESALPVLAAARSCGVDVIAAGVFNSGLLASPRPAADATFDYLPAPESMVRRAHAFADVCQAHDVDLPTVALGFVTRHPAISTVVLGMRSAREVDENVDRCATEVPTGVWDDLVAAGLLPAWAAARA